MTQVAPTVEGRFPLNPPARYFTKPTDVVPGQKMIATVDGPDAGRVFGYVAPWNQCLIGGDPSACFTAPSSPTGYAGAMQGRTQTAEGDMIPTANIGGGINHAPVHPGTFSRQVVDHYANTATQTMRVVYGEDEYGIWAAGALWPDVTDHEIAKIQASALSGDWRWRPEYQAHDMVGSQMVSVPGFPLVRTASVAGDEHPIIVGGMGGAPVGFLEEEITMEQTTHQPGCGFAAGIAAGIQAGTPAATSAAGEAVRACACQTTPAVAAPVVAPDQVPPTPPAPPVADEQTAPDADQAMDDERDQRISDLETAVAELADGLRECQAWFADQAASSLDDMEAEGAVASLPPVLAAFGDQKAPPFGKGDGPGPGGPPKAKTPPGGGNAPHKFVDENGDGKCDVCGKTEDNHSDAPQPVGAGV